MAAFNVKPLNGWVHSDKVIENEGVIYSVRYVGCLEVKVSMKTLDFKTRSNVAKESINRVCEAAGLKSSNKKRKVDRKVLRSIADVPDMKHAGTDVNLKVCGANLTLISIDTDQVITTHEMPKISFASGGDSETLDFVSYIAKDEQDFRACYVLECGGGLAKEVLATIGQAFELRYQQYAAPKTPDTFATAVSPEPTVLQSGGDADQDYYNDLPGKVPPDVEPPPVPPLPTHTHTSVPPLTTLPPISPNLIDFNFDLANLTNLPHHNYVNDSVLFRRDIDIFDMQPFSQADGDNIGQLKNEMWYHGKISRAEAERLLKKDGDFLVRESSTPGQYVLSGMQSRNKKHLLLIDPEGVVRTKDRIFNNVSHLIQFHFENALPIISAESALVLRQMVRRSSVYGEHTLNISIIY